MTKSNLYGVSEHPSHSAPFGAKRLGKVEKAACLAAFGTRVTVKHLTSERDSFKSHRRGKLF